MNPLPTQPADQHPNAPVPPPDLDQPLPPLGSDPAIRASTPPAILEGQTAYLRDLPELLKEKRGQWVAYYGAKRIALAATPEALDDECQRQGYTEYFVRCVWPHAEFDYISAL